MNIKKKLCLKIFLRFDALSLFKETALTIEALKPNVPILLNMVTMVSEYLKYPKSTEPKSNAINRSASNANINLIKYPKKSHIESFKNFTDNFFRNYKTKSGSSFSKFFLKLICVKMNFRMLQDQDLSLYTTRAKFEESVLH